MTDLTSIVISIILISPVWGLIYVAYVSELRKRFNDQNKFWTEIIQYYIETVLKIYGIGEKKTTPARDLFDRMPRTFHQESMDYLKDDCPNIGKKILYPPFKPIDSAMRGTTINVSAGEYPPCDEGLNPKPVPVAVKPMCYANIFVDCENMWAG